MPKLSEREKLTDLERRQRALAEEANSVRRALRGRYGNMLAELPIERLTEKEFRDLIGQAIRTGGTPAVTALKALPSARA